jgi:alcohol dehydrogenase
MLPHYYEFFCPVKIISGKVALPNLPHEIDLLGASRALIVTDQGVVNAGLLKLVQEAFAGAKPTIGAVYDQTPPDSSIKACNLVAKLFKDNNCDCIVAVGGGSVIDTAKGANMVITEGTDDLMKFQGAERAKKPMKPFIAIPTTAGTGSEVTCAAVISDPDRNVKMAFTSYTLFPNVALLDPKMVMTMPPRISAATGMDALTHAIEAYYCIQKNPVSDAFSIAAIKLIMDNLLKTIENGQDADARLSMLNGSLIAGISFSNSMVGVVHALAHACGGVVHLPHGLANSILLPVGMENNLDKRADMIAELAPHLGARATGDVQADARAAIGKVRELQQKLKAACGLAATLKEAGVTEDQLPKIARAAIDDGAVTYNPEDVTYEVALDLLKKAF